MPYDVFLRMENESEERHEWVDGVVYAMSRGTPEHGRLVARAIGKLLTPLSGDGCDAFSSETAIFIEAASHHTYADASLVCGPLITRKVHDRNGKSIGEAIVNPTVIVEILSDSTERYDRDGKFEAYRKLASFETYVLISQDERKIEVRTRREGRWEIQVGTAGESVTIRGRDFAIDAIYD